MRLALIAVAGSAGALCRYGVALTFGAATGGTWPMATVVVNLAGAFVLGALAGRGTLDASDVTAALAVGFLGAFTTFSTFSLEALLLLRDGRPLATLGYVALSVIGGLAAVAAGYTLTSR